MVETVHMTLAEALIIADEKYSALVRSFATDPAKGLAFKSEITQIDALFRSIGLIDDLKKVLAINEDSGLCAAIRFGMRIQRVLDGPEPENAEKPLIVGVM